MDRRQQTWQRTGFDLGLALLWAFVVAAIIFGVWPYLKAPAPMAACRKWRGLPLFDEEPSHRRANFDVHPPHGKQDFPGPLAATADSKAVGDTQPTALPCPPYVPCSWTAFVWAVETGQ
jgi:hypothetical protein